MTRHNKNEVDFQGLVLGEVWVGSPKKKKRVEEIKTCERSRLGCAMLQDCIHEVFKLLTTTHSVICD